MSLEIMESYSSLSHKNKHYQYKITSAITTLYWSMIFFFHHFLFHKDFSLSHVIPSGVCSLAIYHEKWNEKSVKRILCIDGALHHRIHINCRCCSIKYTTCKYNFTVSSEFMKEGQFSWNKFSCKISGASKMRRNINIYNTSRDVFFVHDYEWYTVIHSNCSYWYFI